MLVLFETAAGYAIFKVLDEKKLQEIDSLWKEFETPEKANKIVKLKHFEKFQDTTEALAASTALVEGKISKNLKKILKKIVAKDAHEQLAVADAKLGGFASSRDMASYFSFGGHSNIPEDASPVKGKMAGHVSAALQQNRNGNLRGCSKEKPLPVQVEVQPRQSRHNDCPSNLSVSSQALLDDLDKELNNYIMRCREWYGWHFPELGKIITDNLTYCKCVKKIGDRKNFSCSDLSAVLPEEVEEEVKAAAEISMGTEVSEEDISNIQHLCDQVVIPVEVGLPHILRYPYYSTYPGFKYDKVPPGSLLNLAKHPASTVQILGAEKALFRALKTKRDTPKFGLIYHASLVGQTTAKNKGKISRMLAAKTALTIRYDALGESTSAEMGAENRLKVETRLRHLEEKGIRRISGTGKAMARADKYQHKSEVKTYDPSGESTLPLVPKKRKIEMEVEEENEVPVPKKMKKTKVVEIKEEEEEEAVAEEEEQDDSEHVKKKKKKKEKKQKAQEEAVWVDEDEEEPSTSVVVESTEKKKKKKKKIKEEPEDDD
ncbi:hypothetical protein JD844_023185 [Phrynosoma platyrhinos]|uniref:Nop domain-containing protein n=1 Tax=Phrynosoma platyrhinos TaxID=52577 RepID=A0ABQ7SX75_PHRPL|nr:hypothetical protein JD844_023185 [Phrynosoma platyrhinos]